MKQVSVDEALKFAGEHFPTGPEKLAELLEVEVRRSAFNGDGWCLRHGERAIVRINSNASLKRQRFTLAHELGHLVLDIPSVIGETAREMSRIKSDEERRVNAFAGELLLPISVARRFVRELPITRKLVDKLVQEADVSPLFLMRRLCSLSEELRLQGAALLHYENGSYSWHHAPDSAGGKWIISSPAHLLSQLLEQPNAELKIERPQEQDVMFALLFANPKFDTHTVFVQVLLSDDDTAHASADALATLEAELLHGYRELKSSLEGCMGAMKNRVVGLTLDEAVSLFNQRYLSGNDRWSAEFCERLRSPAGQRYLQQRLSDWTCRELSS